MKALMQWLRLHPVTAVLFTMIFTAVATAAAFREDLWIPLLITYLCVAVFWALIAWLQWRSDWPSIIAVVLAISFSYNSVRSAEPSYTPPSRPETGAMVGAGLVIICVGGYCIYKMVKVCQKKFPPKDTNAPPDQLTFPVGPTGNDESGGAWDYTAFGSCYDGDTNTLLPLAYPGEEFIATLRGMVNTSGSVTMRMDLERDHDGEKCLTWDQFQADLLQHGLYLTGKGDGNKVFERNGVSCLSDAVPFRFDDQTHTVVHDGPPDQMRTVTIERSADMETWSRFLSITTPIGHGFQLTDVTRQGQMFYRVSVR